MVLLKMNFSQQRRVRLAQGLWLLSWMAVLCGTFVFCLGVYLKTELLRRDEVERRKYTHTINTFLTSRGAESKNADVDLTNMSLCAQAFAFAHGCLQNLCRRLSMMLTQTLQLNPQIQGPSALNTSVNTQRQMLSHEDGGC